MKLYEITQEMREIFQMIEDGEITQEEAADTLEASGMSFDEKVQNCLLYRAEQIAESEALAVEIKRLTDRKKACDNRAEQMKDYVRQSMQAVGKTESGGTLVSAKLGKPSVSAHVANDDLLSDQWKKVIKKPDLALIKKELQAGNHIEGAELVEGQPRITIK